MDHACSQRLRDALEAIVAVEEDSPAAFPAAKLIAKEALAEFHRDNP